LFPILGIRNIISISSNSSLYIIYILNGAIIFLHLDSCFWKKKTSNELSVKIEYAA
jgi:hypothetical protein